MPAVWVMFEPPLAKLEVVIESPPEPPSVVVARSVKLFAPDSERAVVEDLRARAGVEGDREAADGAHTGQREDVRRAARIDDEGADRAVGGGRGARRRRSSRASSTCCRRRGQCRRSTSLAVGADSDAGRRRVERLEDGRAVVDRADLERDLAAVLRVGIGEGRRQRRRERVDELRSRRRDERRSRRCDVRRVVRDRSVGQRVVGGGIADRDCEVADRVARRRAWCSSG